MKSIQMSNVSSRVPQFHPMVWVLTTGFLLSRTAYYMVWPFISVILAIRYNMPPTKIGLIMGVGLIVSCVGSLYSGALSDQYGRKKIILLTILLSVFSFWGLSQSVSVVMFFSFAILISISNALFESPAKALLMDLIEDKQLRELSLNIRYFCVNLGAILGPLIGLIFGLTAQTETFHIATSIYFLFFLIVIIGFWLYPVQLTHISKCSQSLHWRKTITVLVKDQAFLLFILGYLLFLMVYVQFQSVFVLYFNSVIPDKSIWLYSWLIMTNGITIILFQFPLTRYFQKRRIIISFRVGVLLMASSLMLFSITPPQLFYVWIGLMVIFSVGEVIIFPMLEIFIDRIAPANLKGTYFGAAYLSRLGIGMGPFIGGWLLEHLGGFWLFLGATITLILAMVALQSACRRVSF